MDFEVDQGKENQSVLILLETLKKASKDLQSNSIFLTNNNDSKITVEILSRVVEAEAATVLPSDPKLLNISQLLCNLKTLLEKLEKFQGYGLKSILHRQITNYKISQVAFTTEAEIQSFLDRNIVQILARTLKESADEDKKVRVLIEFKNRVCQGFDRAFQHLILRAKVFSILESLLCNSTCSKRARDHAALVVDALVRFNRNVFVGLVLMGPTVGALISMGSCRSAKVLCSLITFIRTPLVDEMESNGEIPRIINLLSSEDLSIRAAALDCILELAYFGREEVILAMLGEDLVRKLVELQRLENGSGVLEKENGGTYVGTESDTKLDEKGSKNMENHPFESCVTRFAVQVEVGEGLSSIEKREVKLEILRRVRETSISDAESATIEAEPTGTTRVPH
ncbi:uncharacterized protein LOC122318303 isoform X2 [Carya illinoinensis]|uniref:uncharacterized protein LOC122318303 isoform X2 n=1 Tax=Carya illinoinensis TaxID=32201 RepID=UPI001C71E64D|nr:uncharacterized protein LOC122318303 isoform X2 [Carya illinoinensis]